MKNNDVDLIHRIFTGDEAAFAELVEKYQQQVHALAWRKIGDFHIAEEITQDTFLKAYQNLASLKNPYRFAGWLYVIATRCCQDWLRKKHNPTKSLEEVGSEDIQPDAYSRYVAAQQTKGTVEEQRQIVKKLLATLPESERTVITLHYFGEMTCEKMSEFLGVSANTIKSRLRRARNRLKKEEQMIREAIGNFQITPNLTDNIMLEIYRLKTTVPSASKPLVPWVIAASSAILILFLLGIGSQYLARFQKPYSLDAQSDMTVDLIDAQVVQNSEEKPDVRNQLGDRSDTSDSENGDGEKTNQVLRDGDDYTLWGLPEGAKRRLGKGMFTDMQLSPDGSNLAISSSTGIWLYDVSTGKETALLTNNSDLIGLVAFSPDGTTLASISGENTCRIWDIEKQKLLTTFEVPKYWFYSLRFLDDGKTLVGEGLIDKKSHTLTGKILKWDVPKVWMWDSGTGKLLNTFTTELPKFNPLKDLRSSVLTRGFGYDSKAIFVFENKDQTISVKDGRTDSEIAKLPAIGQEIKAFAFSQDGRILAIAYSRGVQIWNLVTGTQMATLPIRIATFSGNPSILAFSKNGRILAVASGKNISVWDINANFQIATFENNTGGLWEFVLSSDGTTLITMDHQGAVDLWSVNTGKHKRTLTKGYTSRFTTFAFAHDGKTIASTAGGKTQLWNTNTGAEELRMQIPVHTKTGDKPYDYHRINKAVPSEPGNDIISLAFSKDNTILNTFKSTGKIGMGNVVTGEYKTFKTIVNIDSPKFRSIYSNPLTKGILTSPLPQTPNVYHLFATSFDNASIYTPKSIFSPDGNILAAKNRSGTIEVWDIPTQKRLYTSTRQNPNVEIPFILAFTPNGKTLAVVDESEVHLSNTGTGKTVARFNIPKKKRNLLNRLRGLFGKDHVELQVGVVALGGEVKSIVAASRGKTIYLWDVATQERILTIKGHTDAICKLALTTDGSLLASGDIGGTIHLWDIPSGNKLATYKPYASQVTELIFSPDGKTLASTNLHSRFAGSILLWDVPSK